ncbi:hypothetical protein [Albidovulum inexpectatum]|uniref:hypothetical protein n=1 Tax=Albidovulum inexpectatum TaxID=196587 RepID=UPI0011B03131|nr:hypothetical protein [Albidovulum inexpectatum]
MEEEKLSASNVTRRILILSVLALCACQASGVGETPSRTLTGAYDGEYTLTVGRTHNPTPENARDPLSYPNKYESLAFLRLRVEGGRISVLRVDEAGVAKGYTDFSGAFYDGGILEFRTTVGYMFHKSDTFDLHVVADVGDQLLSGKEVVLRPDGFNANYAAHVAIKKVG